MISVLTLSFIFCPRAAVPHSDGRQRPHGQEREEDPELAQERDSGGAGGLLRRQEEVVHLDAGGVGRKGGRGTGCSSGEGPGINHILMDNASKVYR